jgi:hypothetical protein
LGKRKREKETERQKQRQREEFFIKEDLWSLKKANGNI